MIKINKSATIPAVLQGEKVAAEKERLLFEVAAGNVSVNMAFDSNIYSHQEVKAQLEKDQHGKCAYCESKMRSTSFGEVEHFRPKAGWQQQKKDSLKQPGYYRLAYEWDNLLFSCSKCNNAKRNVFPIRNATQRAIHHETVVLEEALLVHPAFDCPEDHIAFHEEAAVALSDRGEETIAVCDLNRPELKKDREKHYQSQRLLKEALSIIPPDNVLHQKIRERMHFGLSPHAEYSGMMRGNSTCRL